MEMRLENIFLTAASTVGMQWVEQGNTRPAIITIWKDKHGKLSYSTTRRPSAAMIDSCRAIYKHTNHLYIKGAK